MDDIDMVPEIVATNDGSEITALSHFKMFYIMYDGTLTGGFFCLLTMSPLFIFVILSYTLFSYEQGKNPQRNILIMIALATSIVINYYLKHFFRHPRPSSHYHGHGMPSDHAQFMTLFAGYFTLLLSDHQRFNWSNKYTMAKHHEMIILLWVWALLVIYSRYYLLFHTWPQLIAGAFVGLILAKIWYQIDKKFIFDINCNLIHDGY